MLHPSIEARRGAVAGVGLFATVSLGESEVVWWKAPGDVVEFFTLEEIGSWDAEAQRRFFATSCQVGKGRYSGPRDGVIVDIADYMNHSCDPNTWFVDDDTMVAMRAIQAGEEITYDYATSECDEGFEIVCACRAPTCRGVVRGTDFATRPALRERYGAHAMRHVLESCRAK